MLKTIKYCDLIQVFHIFGTQTDAIFIEVALHASFAENAIPKCTPTKMVDEKVLNTEKRQ